MLQILKSAKEKQQNKHENQWGLNLQFSLHFVGIEDRTVGGFGLSSTKDEDPFQSSIASKFLEGESHVLFIFVSSTEFHIKHRGF